MRRKAACASGAAELQNLYNIPKLRYYGNTEMIKFIININIYRIKILLETPEKTRKGGQNGVREIFELTAQRDP